MTNNIVIQKSHALVIYLELLLSTASLSFVPNAKAKGGGTALPICLCLCMMLP